MEQEFAKICGGDVAGVTMYSNGKFQAVFKIAEAADRALKAHPLVLGEPTLLY